MDVFWGLGARGFFRCCLCALLLVATAVAWSRGIVDATELDRLQPGETTRESVLERLGPPEQEERGSDGRTACLYAFDFSAAANAASAGPVKGKVALLFDANGRFQGARFYGQDEAH